MNSVSTTANNVSAQMSVIPMLNGTNFKVWKENVEIVLGCMDLDLALRIERPTLAEDNSNEAKVERWDRSNRMSLMIMKCSIPEAFRGSISESEKRTHEERVFQVCCMACKEGVVSGADRQLMMKDSFLWVMVK